MYMWFSVKLENFKLSFCSIFNLVLVFLKQCYRTIKGHKPNETSVLTKTNIRKTEYERGCCYCLVTCMLSSTNTSCLFCYNTLMWYVKYVHFNSLCVNCDLMIVLSNLKAWELSVAKLCMNAFCCQRFLFYYAMFVAWNEKKNPDHS